MKPVSLNPVYICFMAFSAFWLVACPELLSSFQSRATHCKPPAGQVICSNRRYRGWPPPPLASFSPSPLSPHQD
jgi:hypothetical protein